MLMAYNYRFKTGLRMTWRWGLLVFCALVAAQREAELWCGACKGLFDEIEYRVSEGESCYPLPRCCRVLFFG